MLFGSWDWIVGMIFEFYLFETWMMMRSTYILLCFLIDKCLILQYTLSPRGGVLEDDFVLEDTF